MTLSKKVSENVTKKISEGFISPEDKKYMEGKPNRIEIANYVNSLMENHYMPMITNYIQISSMVIQAILLEKGICTGDEIKKITEKFVEENKYRSKLMQTYNKVKTSDIKLTDELINNLELLIKDLEEGNWKAEGLSKDEFDSIFNTISQSSILITNINVNSEDKELMKAIKNRLPEFIDSLNNLSLAISNNSIHIKTSDNKQKLKNLLIDLISRFTTINKIGDEGVSQKS